MQQVVKAIPLFDAYDCLAHEQIPRVLDAEFSPSESRRSFVNGRAVDLPVYPGHPFGAALHVAFATCLGWSPVLRDAAGWLRRSSPEVAAVQDCEAARTVERAVAAMALDHDGEVTDRLVELVMAGMAGLEVAASPPFAIWYALTHGLEAVRALTATDGGVLFGDLRVRMIEWEALPLLATS